MAFMLHGLQPRATWIFHVQELLHSEADPEGGGHGAMPPPKPWIKKLKLSWRVTRIDALAVATALSHLMTGNKERPVELLDCCCCCRAVSSGVGGENLGFFTFKKLKKTWKVQILGF